MSYFGKKFVVAEEENGLELLQALEMPPERINSMLKFKNTFKIDKDGDSYTLYLSLPNGEKQIKFTSGVEVEEQIAPNVIATSVFTVNGNVISREQKFPKYTLTRVLEFSDNQLIETVTTSTWDGKARYTYIPA